MLSSAYSRRCCWLQLAYGGSREGGIESNGQTWHIASHMEHPVTRKPSCRMTEYTGRLLKLREIMIGRGDIMDRRLSYRLEVSRSKVVHLMKYFRLDHCKRIETMIQSTFRRLIPRNHKIDGFCYRSIWTYRSGIRNYPDSSSACMLQ